jgi:hypothetical protein
VYVRHELEAKDGCSWKLRPVRRPIEREIATLGCRGSTPSNVRPMHSPAPDLGPDGDFPAAGMLKPARPSRRQAVGGGASG